MKSNFFNLVEKNLRKIKESQSEKINIVSKMFYETYKNNGLIYLFGTGHSHMLAEDGHFRAGGFAAICPILSTNITFCLPYQRGNALAKILTFILFFP